jgi:ATP-dependent protease ClpP protease subunit
MGGLIAQAGDVRQIRRHSWLHIHEASAGAWGKASDMKESAEYIERITRDMAEIYANRGAVKSAQEIYDRIERREWWLSAEEALAEGFVDEIV